MKRTLAALLLLAPAAALAAPSGTVVGSKHDLSVTGPGPIRATDERSACVFCHVMHGSAPGALSGRPDTKAKHVPYASSTMVARPDAPTGASRVCLSCHDGTIAVGKTLRRNIRTTVDRIPEGSASNLGTDLRGMHPVSFRPSRTERARTPDAGDPVKLDRHGELQCTSCHDPHKEWGDPEQGKFLVKSNRRSALCRSCHDSPLLDSAGSAHARAEVPFSALQGNEGKFASVADAGCAACHASHATAPGGRLVKRKAADPDDVACLGCHSGLVARANVGRQVSKIYAHDGSQGRGVHDAVEGRGQDRKLPEASPGTQRHVACVDCHNPHTATDRPTVAPEVPGALYGASGVDQTGRRVEQARFEYEVCFKCHADSANKPQSFGVRPPDTVRREVVDVNLRQVFAPSAFSYHPVVSPGKNPDVPSLLAPYTIQSMIYCGDCHASDDGPGAGGSGARGPHGSQFQHLLERSYLSADRTVEAPSSYALCYKCHDRDRLLLDAEAARGNSAFRKQVGASAISLHKLHVQDRGTACATCHTAHGVSQGAATAGDHAHLVNFDVSVVRAVPGGGPMRFQDRGARSGACAVLCHGVTHSLTDPKYSY
jgi:predicted CXXCH cytochrome family protein